MTRPLMHIITLLLATLMLAGCSKPETPQEVTKAFWEAVIEGDGAEVAELSTLVDAEGYDGYSLDFEGASLSWGRVTVDEARAEIDTVIGSLPQGGNDALETTTYLVRINDQWQVDYHRTGDDLAGKIRLESLMGNLRGLSNELRSRFADESRRASEELDRLADEFAALSEEAERELSATIQAYGNDLDRTLERFSRSLDEALQEQDGSSAQERQQLEDARKRLEQQRENLDQTDPDSMARASKQLAEIQRQLSELSGQTLNNFQEEWHRWSDDLNRELDKLNQQSRKYPSEAI